MKSKFLLSFFLIISIAAKCQLYNYVQCPTFENQTGYDNSCFTSNDQAGIWCSDGAINDQIRWNNGQSNYIYVDCTLPEFGYTDGTIKVLGYQTLASGNRCAGLIRTCLNDNGTPVSSKGKFSLKLSPNLNSNEDYAYDSKLLDGMEMKCLVIEVLMCLSIYQMNMVKPIIKLLHMNVIIMVALTMMNGLLIK